MSTPVQDRPLEEPVAVGELIDSHVHLNFDSYTEDLDAVAQRWRERGIRQLVHSCCSPMEFPELQAVADRYPEVFLAVGLHPLEVEHWVPEMTQTIQTLAHEDPRVVAIGETGLDFYKAEATTIERQYEAFRAQLQIARTLDRAVIIHCRDAAEATRKILDEQDPSHELRIVMHCWSGTPEETRWFVERGCWVSFSGIVTFKSAKTVQASVAEVPGDRILVETDCPFLSPVPKRGKRNEPAHVAYVADKVAELRGISRADLAQQTTANARQLFRLPLPQTAVPSG